MLKQRGVWHNKKLISSCSEFNPCTEDKHQLSGRKNSKKLTGHQGHILKMSATLVDEVCNKLGSICRLDSVTCIGTAVVYHSKLGLDLCLTNFE